ncbi:MAG: class II aldolase/adducin family protein [Rhodobacteraceae bacterium]|nr:class II aldolase/adducin family protein [Paracoccaceae bacterium]
MPSLPDIPREFLSLSQRIGSDHLLVQGGGGNTSFKQDGVLWIKASGTELSRAGTDDIFVAVDESRALAELDGTGDGTCREAAIGSRSNNLPSIETTFHALLPHRFVFHYHSVRSLVHSIAIEGRQTLNDKLAGLNWVSVPYIRPGIPLSKEIRRAFLETNADIFVLENHGLIVAGSDCPRIAETIAELENRLDMPTRNVDAETGTPLSLQGWKPCPRAASLANDNLSRVRAAAGSYYPDHVVFLGPGIDVVTIEQLTPRSDCYGPAMVIPSVSSYLREEAPRAAESMLICLNDILVRIPDGWKLQPLSPEAEAELLGWDAEAHRKRMATQS